MKKLSWEGLIIIAFVFVFGVYALLLWGKREPSPAYKSEIDKPVKIYHCQWRKGGYLEVQNVEVIK